VTTAYYPVTIPVRTTAPTLLQEPVTLDEAKVALSLAVDSHNHDAELRSLIPEARAILEKDASIACYTGEYKFKKTVWKEQDSWGDWFELNLRPITAITSIAYIATDGTSTTWSSSEYALDTYTITPIVKLAYGESWPTLRGDVNGITVTATAGYATVDAIPFMIKTAVKACIRLLWLKDSATNNDINLYERLVYGIKRHTYS
jgi:uncharacterized phiE125 gp8 family phage protein